jgi:hypothetical protein
MLGCEIVSASIVLLIVLNWYNVAHVSDMLVLSLSLPALRS